MIARMSKYDLVLYAGQSSDFIEKLRGLGLVDIPLRGGSLRTKTVSCCFRSTTITRRSMP